MLCYILQLCCRDGIDTGQQVFDVPLFAIVQIALGEVEGILFPIVAGYHDLSFDLVYVDNNSTPELLVRSEEYGNQVDIVSYYNGKLLDLQDLGFDGAVYVKAHSGLIYEECGRQGIYHKYITKLNNGKKKVIASGTQEAQDAAMTTYTYTWNGKEVTKAEYECAFF